MTAGQTVRVRFTRLGKREQVEATAPLKQGQTIGQVVAAIAHEQAGGELKGVPLRVRIVRPAPTLKVAGLYAYVEADMPKGGKPLPTRVGHGPVWVEEVTT